MDAAAQKYVRYVSSLNGNASLVTDKMPDNFLYLGLINLLFPEARIVHCIRNPIDTCLSCYFQQFSGHYPYAYDLENLGHYYHEYRKLMEHWKSVLSVPVFDLHYEHLVRESRETVEQLLEFCGMEWSDCCMEFDKSARTVTTASSQQATKPLYTSSVERWRNYSDFIAPLLAEFNQQRLE